MEFTQMKREPLTSRSLSSTRHHRGQIGRASLMGLLLAGVIGAALGAGWIGTRGFLGVQAEHTAESADSAASPFLGQAPAWRAPAVDERRVEPDNVRRVDPVKIVSVPKAGWEGRADHFGAGLALANP